MSPPPQAKTYTGDDYYTVEDFGYDEIKDQFVCPAGACLRCVSTEKQRGRKLYRAGRSVCRQCPRRSECTPGKYRTVKVTAHHAALIRLRADSKTEDFQQLYRSRAPGIEGVFAEAKQRHGLRRAWRRGLTKMRIQCLLIAAVINFKRLITLLMPHSASVRADYALIRLLGTLFTAIECLFTPITTSQSKHPQNALASA